MSIIYPPELLPQIKSAWKAPSGFHSRSRPALPNDDALKELLDLAYQTSLLREEGRKLTFRILYLPRDKGKKRGTTSVNRRNSRLAEFSNDRQFTIAELRRLAPAADAIRSMICVDYVKGEWRVWAILDTGANWWNFSRHESSSGTPPPENLAIYSQGPGELTISSGGFTLLSLRSGSVYVPLGSALHRGPVSSHFQPARELLYKETIEKLEQEVWDEDGEDDDYPNRFYDMCLSRILSGIRELGHGGTLIVVPDHLSLNDSRLTDRITIKHQCNYDFAWNLMIQSLELHNKYYALHFPLWESKKPIATNDYHSISILASRRLENSESLSDCLRFIASLSSVDGALILTTKMRLIGFGGEITAQSPTLQNIQLSANPDASALKRVSIESYGTRHRSAFRFVSSYEDAIAFVISSDGGVKAAKRIGSNVVLWPEVQANQFD
jgi:hypothetical protein